MRSKKTLMVFILSLFMVFIMTGCKLITGPSKVTTKAPITTAIVHTTLDPSLTTLAPSTTKKEESTTTIAKTHTITLKQAGAQDIVIVVNDGETYDDDNLPKPQGIEGYTVSWNYNSETFVNIKRDLVITTVKIANKYKITFDSDGGTKIAVKTVTYDASYTLPIPSKDEYTFAGWTKDGVSFESTGTWKTTSDITLKATWVETNPKINLNAGESYTFEPEFGYVAESYTFFVGEEETTYSAYGKTSTIQATVDGTKLRVNYVEASEITGFTISGTKSNNTYVWYDGENWYQTADKELTTYDTVVGFIKDAGETPLPKEQFTFSAKGFSKEAGSDEGKVIMWGGSTYNTNLYGKSGETSSVTFTATKYVYSITITYRTSTYVGRATVYSNEREVAGVQISDLSFTFIINSNEFTIENASGSNCQMSSIEIVYKPYTEADVLKEKQDAIVATGYAFSNQGTQIQYDQLNYRRNININPEDATELMGMFQDCSSYCNSVYMYVFGIGVLKDYSNLNTATVENYASSHTDASDVVEYIKNSDYTTSAAKSELLAKVKAELKPGDLVNYRHGSAGHIMLYIGNNLFLHCTGSSYSYNYKDPSLSYDKATKDENSKGAVVELSANEVFNSSGARYLFASDNTSFAVIRPLNREGMELTQKAIDRLALSGIIGEKKSDKTFKTVRNKDVITYTITLENYSSKTIVVPEVTDLIPTGTTFKASSNGTLVDGKVVFSNIEVAGKGEVDLVYSVTVESTAPSFIRSEEGYIGAIPLNDIYSTYSSSISETNITALISAAKNALGSTSTLTSIQYINSLYNGILGNNIYSTTLKTKEALNLFIDTENDTYIKETNELTLILMDDMIGAGSIREGYPKDNTTIRYMKEDFLEEGDILLTYYADDESVAHYEAYIYVGDGKLIYVNASGVVTALNIYSNEFNPNQTSYYPKTNFLVQLISNSKFAVLRPSLYK